MVNILEILEYYVTSDIKFIGKLLMNIGCIHCNIYFCETNLLMLIFVVFFSLVVKLVKILERPRQRPCQGPQEPVYRLVLYCYL